MKNRMNSMEFESREEILVFIELIDFAEREVYKSMRKTLNLDSRFILQSELTNEIEVYGMLKRIYEDVLGWDYCVEDTDFYDLDLVDIEIKNSKEASILCIYIQKMIKSINSGYFESMYLAESVNTNVIFRHLDDINNKLERIYLAS
ncbi:hypothetical protein [Peptacetobacter hiranonis]|uniref:hypothetical protein n=1 Tax=Peptacetobacter hiranonis TaxID=89152 RepID=UPI0022DF8292|nr:hypothetical protein [Peptacetobacter hiranonis]